MTLQLQRDSVHSLRLAICHVQLVTCNLQPATCNSERRSPPWTLTLPLTTKTGRDVVLFFDTTLRDGEQSPGATLNIEEKLEIARQLARLGVDIIEAGFPIASPGDFEAVRRIADEVGTLRRERSDGRTQGRR